MIVCCAVELSDEVYPYYVRLIFSFIYFNILKIFAETKMEKKFFAFLDELYHLEAIKKYSFLNEK